MRYAILCAGQAGQRREMLDAVFAAPECAQVLDSASELLGCNVEPWWRGLADDAMFDNRNAQFAIALLEIATWLRLQPQLAAPVAVAGYSLGELVAYFVAGALDARECLRLALERARLMGESAKQADDCMILLRGGALAACRYEIDHPDRMPGLHVAIRRCAAGVVLGGDPQAVRSLAARFDNGDGDVIILPVRVPSHTPHLTGAAQAFRELLLQSELRAPRCPVLAGIDATPVRSREAAIYSLARQICTTVRWDLCTEALSRMRLDAVLEIGPGNDLSRLLMDCGSDVPARAVSDFSDPLRAVDWLQAR